MSEKRQNLRSIFLSLISSLAIGFAVWALSPYLTGEKEPWDAFYPFYSTVLIGGSALITLVTGWKGALLCVPGIWLGQVLALAVLPWLDRSWWQLGLVSTAIGSLIALKGVVLGGILLLALGRSRRRLV